MTCYAHDGQDEDDQSGVVFTGRDRSKLGILKRKRAEERELEDEEEEEVLESFNTPKVSLYGTIWATLTLTENSGTVLAWLESSRPLRNERHALRVMLPHWSPNPPVLGRLVSLRSPLPRPQPFRPRAALRAPVAVVVAGNDCLWFSLSPLRSW
jgi:hypothetical protein